MKNDTVSGRSPARTFWFTGLSGAGKSTLAGQLTQILGSLHVPCHTLDGDALRQGLCRDLGYSAQARSENVRRVAEVAKLFNEADVHAIVALISPYRDDRDMARQILGDARFCEIHVSTSLTDCARRDPKGLYALAYAGKIPEFSGVSAPYERPIAPALSIDTGRHSLAECAGLLEAFVQGESRRRPALRSVRANERP
jgi:adenylylsulfate kinase